MAKINNLGNYQDERFGLTAVQVPLVAGNFKSGWLLTTTIDRELQRMALDWSGILALHKFLGKAIEEERVVKI